MLQIPMGMADVLAAVIVGVASALVTAFIGAWFVAAADVRRHNADILALDRRLAEWIVIADRNLQRELKVISASVAASGKQYDGATTNALAAARTETIYGYRQQALDSEVARAGFMASEWLPHRIVRRFVGTQQINTVQSAEPVINYWMRGTNANQLSWGVADICSEIPERITREAQDAVSRGAPQG